MANIRSVDARNARSAAENPWNLIKRSGALAVAILVVASALQPGTASANCDPNNPVCPANPGYTGTMLTHADRTAEVKYQSVNGGRIPLLSNEQRLPFGVRITSVDAIIYGNHSRQLEGRVKQDSGASGRIVCTYEDIYRNDNCTVNLGRVPQD